MMTILRCTEYAPFPKEKCFNELKIVQKQPKHFWGAQSIGVIAMISV